MVGAISLNLLEKIHNCNMDGSSRAEELCENCSVEIGDRIKCNDSFGTVKYIGQVSGYKGTWYGVDWDELDRGKHNGTVDGIQYFVASGEKSASFIRPNKIAPAQSCADAIRKYYGDKEDETTAALTRSIIYERKREMNAPFIEMVGFEDVQEKQGQLESLRTACVRDRCVSRAGELRRTCPRLRCLDLACNLLARWEAVADVAAQLPLLADLNLSKNRLAIPSEDKLQEMSPYFQNLEKLDLSFCNYDWSQILTLARLWPRIEELVLPFNRISCLSMPPGASLSSLATLRLDGNPIDKWEDVLQLGNLKNLTLLSLNECDIETIRFNDCSDGSKVDVFPNLRVLFISRNKIKDWRSISELNKLRSLSKLYMHRNPVQLLEDADTTAQLIVAKLESLQELNGSQLSREYRRGAEYDYLKRHGLQYKRAQQERDALRAFHAQHCRFRQLVDKYGLPDDSLLEIKPQSSSLTSKLIEVTLKDEQTGATLTKKFPSTMSVQKVAAFAQRAFSKSYAGKVFRDNPSLSCVDDTRQGVTIPLDNDMKDLNFFSVKSGDTILVKLR